MSDELKPCPFCGGKATMEVRHQYVAFPFVARCTNIECDVIVSAPAKFRGTAIERWNTRADAQKRSHFSTPLSPGKQT